MTCEDSETVSVDCLFEKGSDEAAKLQNVYGNILYWQGTESRQVPNLANVVTLCNVSEIGY